MHTYDIRQPGLDLLINKLTDCNITYKASKSNAEKLILAGDMQFGSNLHPATAQKGGIIFEVAYSESLKHTQEKAKLYLWASDLLQPSVVVIFNFTEKNSSFEYRDLVLRFEVHRRHLSNTDETQVHETGVSALGKHSHYERFQTHW